jgi:hypothetical protein
VPDGSGDAAACGIFGFFDFAENAAAIGEVTLTGFAQVHAARGA